jgi:flagellar motor switch protein FliN
MLMDEPGEEITDEHFDGLKEGLEQVLGQIKMSVDDEKGTFAITDLKVEAADSFDSIQGNTLETEGGLCHFNLTTEGDSFTLSLYSWPKDPAQFSEEQFAQPEQPQQVEDFPPENPVQVQSAQFGDIAHSGSTPGDPKNVNMLLDVELEIRVEIDRKTVLVSDLLKLGKGSIVELEKSAGEPLDIYVNGRKFAEGEVVVIDDKFGIRITQLISPKDRVQSLGATF